jgi:hypothetical protein
MDQLDRAIKEAGVAAPASTPPSPDQAVPDGIRFEVPVTQGRKAVVILPTPILDVDLFAIQAQLSKWFMDVNKAEHGHLPWEQPAIQPAPASALGALPPIPGKPNGH